MSKKKRKFNSEVISPSSLRLQKTASTLEKHAGQTDLIAPKRQLFSPELIARLTERIKKL